MTSWKHLECFKRPPHLALSAIANIDALKPEDHAGVHEWYANPGAWHTKRKAERMAQAVAEAGAPPASPPTKKSRAAAPSAGKCTPEKAAAAQGEVARRQAYEELFGGLPVEQLKACLRANEQLLSGNKADLVERCVDRKLYGNLPRCGKCGLGRLRVSYSALLGHGGQGTFTCPGGYDDDEYVRCSFRAQSVARPPWIETGHEAYIKPPRKSTGGDRPSLGGASAAAAAIAAAAVPAAGGTPASGGASSAAATTVDADGCLVVD
eukprot:CAMPEP_0119059550 /NCGR_PEP_ID=MMETSP1178-20130426/3682_1 /TAXON_ID=33656 /ORGANISM="unid sp, Strain CCMP2000" /LENGTH=264 /DNA_ID=CAMNT_0007040591 /DNA_START=210 /DNA_END=1004 /DNA_ORIENTATION=-